VTTYLVEHYWPGITAGEFRAATQCAFRLMLYTVQHSKEGEPCPCA